MITVHHVGSRDISRLENTFASLFERDWIYPDWLEEMRQDYYRLNADGWPKKGRLDYERSQRP